RLADINEARYIDMADVELDSIRARILDGSLGGYIVLDESVIKEAQDPTLVYGGSGGISLLSSIRSDLRDVVREERLARQNASEEVRNSFETKVGLESIKLTEKGEEQDNTIFASVIGFILGLFIFMGIFIYGSVLLRSVLEEKTNR